MGINGAHNQDEVDAAELFPHTSECTRKLRSMHLRRASLSCTCSAKQRRKTYLYLVRRAKRMSYVDAYARIRFQAKQRAERARSPQEQQAFLEVASWADDLEIRTLDDGPEKS